MFLVTPITLSCTTGFWNRAWHFCKSHSRLKRWPGKCVKCFPPRYPSRPLQSEKNSSSDPLVERESIVYARPVVFPRPSPEKFYKGRSQEKTHSLRLGFFLLRSPPDRAKSVLTFRAMGSVSRDCAPVVWVFSTSGFSSLVRDEACQFRNQKAERWSGANHSSI